MIEKIAAVEGGLQEETTYDGRKLRWSEEARKGLWTMKNAYQRRRVKARVEKRARMKKLDAITLEFARQVIEEETGAPLEIQSASSRLRAEGASASQAGTAEPGNGEARLIARDERKNPLISTFDWTTEAVQRILRVPAGFMRNQTQERIEELARERAAAPRQAIGEGGGDRSGARRRRDRDRQADDGRDDRELLRTGREPRVATTARDYGAPLRATSDTVAESPKRGATPAAARPARRERLPQRGEPADRAQSTAPTTIAQALSRVGTRMLT